MKEIIRRYLIYLLERQKSKTLTSSNASVAMEQLGTLTLLVGIQNGAATLEDQI